MPLFKYQAKKSPKEIIEDVIEAESREKAIEKLSQKNCFPIKIEEISQDYEPIISTSPISSTKIKPKNIVIFSRQLASLLKSGVPLSRSLSIISEQTEDLRFKKLLNNIYSRIKDGESFSAVLARYPKTFPPLYIAIIQAGESSGNLTESLFRIADYLKKQNDFLSRVRSALIYPVFMALLGIFTIMFMFMFVMPRLVKIFSDIGQALPLPTQIVLNISIFCQRWWMLILAVIIVLVFFFKKGLKMYKGIISQLKLHIPILGSFNLKVELIKFFRSLEILVSNGIPISEAIKIAAPILDNEVIKKAIEQGHKQVQEGGSFGYALKKSKLFPAFMVNLIIVAEESGKFADG
ncbi:MAG: type II secretion system F family protein, partial [Candidatus Ratteibacteria bacterium]|nr:type II secretion system F family protein [Candidatus Ratteibacteria bacterium]